MCLKIGSEKGVLQLEPYPISTEKGLFEGEDIGTLRDYFTLDLNLGLESLESSEEKMVLAIGEDKPTASDGELPVSKLLPTKEKRSEKKSDTLSARLAHLQEETHVEIESLFRETVIIV